MTVFKTKQAAAKPIFLRTRLLAPSLFLCSFVPSPHEDQTHCVFSSSRYTYIYVSHLPSAFNHDYAEIPSLFDRQIARR